MAKKLTTSNIYSRWKNTVYKQAGGKSALNIYELRFFGYSQIIEQKYKEEHEADLIEAEKTWNL